MADKKQFDGSETSEKSKSLLFSLSQAKPASTAEAETSANQSLLYTLWKSVSGKFAKPAQPQEEKPAAQEPEAELFEDDHPLARLRRAWSQEQAASRGDNTDSDQAPFGPRDLLDGGELLPVHRRLIEQAARSAAEMLASFHGDGEQLQAVNGHVGVMESEDGLSAWLLLLPPLYGGGDVTLEHLYTALVERGITYGVDIQALETLAQPLYFRIVEAARGTPPVDGEDGSVEEVIPTSSSVRFVETGPTSMAPSLPPGKGAGLCRLRGKTRLSARTALRSSPGLRARLFTGRANTMWSRRSQSMEMSIFPQATSM